MAWSAHAVRVREQPAGQCRVGPDDRAVRQDADRNREHRGDQGEEKGDGGDGPTRRLPFATKFVKGRQAAYENENDRQRPLARDENMAHGDRRLNSGHGDPWWRSSRPRQPCIRVRPRR